MQLNKDQKTLEFSYEKEDKEDYMKHVKLSMCRMRLQPIIIQKAAFKIWCYVFNNYKEFFCFEKKKMSNIEKALKSNDFWLAWLDSVLR